MAPIDKQFEALATGQYTIDLLPSSITTKNLPIIDVKFFGQLKPHQFGNSPSLSPLSMSFPHLFPIAKADFFSNNRLVFVNYRHVLLHYLKTGFSINDTNPSVFYPFHCNQFFLPVIYSIISKNDCMKNSSFFLKNGEGREMLRNLTIDNLQQNPLLRCKFLSLIEKFTSDVVGTHHISKTPKRNYPVE